MDSTLETNLCHKSTQFNPFENSASEVCFLLLSADHTPFLIKDEPAERQYKFALHSSLEKASDSSVLAGYKIHVTKSVKPDPANMKGLPITDTQFSVNFTLLCVILFHIHAIQ